MLKYIFFIISVLLFSACSNESNTKKKSTSLQYNIVGMQGKMHFVYTALSDADSFREIAYEICAKDSICIVHFWNNKQLTPVSLPMSDEQVNAKVASYNYNKNTKLQRLLICSVDGCN